MLADCERRYRLWRDYRIGPKPSVSFFTLGKRFTSLRNRPEHAWLKTLPYAAVRHTLKYLAEAYQRFLRDPANEGKPRFKSRSRTTPGFTLPDNVRLDGTRLSIPKVGWVRLAGHQGRWPLPGMSGQAGATAAGRGPTPSQVVCLRLPCRERRPCTGWGR